MTRRSPQDASERQAALSAIVEARAEDAREAIYALLVKLAYGPLAPSRWLVDEILALAEVALRRVE